MKKFLSEKQGGIIMSLDNNEEKADKKRNKGINTVNDDTEDKEEENGENLENELGYCHKQPATFFPEQNEEIVMGVKQIETVLVPYWFECIGGACNFWCVEEEMCIDTCEHNKKGHIKEVKND